MKSDCDRLKRELHSAEEAKKELESKLINGDMKAKQEVEEALSKQFIGFEIKAKELEALTRSKLTAAVEGKNEYSSRLARERSVFEKEKAEAAGENCASEMDL